MLAVFDEDISCSGARGVIPKMLIGREGAHVFDVNIFGGVEHLRGRSMFASWKKSYCPIGADR